MPASLISLALSLLVAARADTVDDPRAIVQRALHVVEGDSAQRVAAPWRARLARDSTDRATALGLATLARLTYDYPTAERLYRRLFADSAHPDRVAVYARLGLAQGLWEQGSVREVDGLLARARAEAHELRDRTAEGEALLWLSIVRGSVYGADAALALSDSALSVLPEAAQDLRAASRCRRAHVLVASGRREAGAELRGALAFARRVGEPQAEARCLRVLALELEGRGKPDSALAVYRTLEELRRRIHDRSGLAQVLSWRAAVLRAEQAAYGEFLTTQHEALVEARASHNLGVVAEVQLGFGALFYTLNDYAAAADRVDQAIAAFEAQGDSAGVMIGRSWRAYVSLAAGDLTEARREVLEALDYYRRQGNVGHQAELYQALAEVAMRERDWAAAERALDEAGALYRRDGSPASIAEQPFERGRLALARGDLAGAERAFTRYLGGLDSTERLPRYEARTRLAEVYARRGELARAERELAVASDELDRWRATLADRELRLLAFQASASEENDRNASVARVLALLASGGRSATAFELAERRRAREMADRMLQAGAFQTRGERHPAGVPARQPARRVTAAEISALIPDDSTALMEYATGAFGAPTSLFVLTRPAPGRPLVRALVLPPADSLTTLIARFDALVEGGADPLTLSRSLGAMLLNPAIAQLEPRITRLVIVPDGPLHRLPFDALRLANGHLAVERYAISVAPSAAVVATLWRRDRDREATLQPVRLLAFGDPVFDSSAQTSSLRGGDDGVLTGTDGETYRSVFDKSGGLPRLKASAREAQLVARYAPEAEVRLREGASAAYLRTARLTGYRILHFATHALVDERSMMRTALALAPGGGGESGFVGPAELAALRLDADLVVLSACRTAGGVVVDGEGVQGLTAPLLEAGARAVVASGWRIADESTVGFVDAFYGALARGLSVADALRSAKLDALRRGAPVREWAAFTAVGDPSVRIPLRTPSQPTHRLVVGVAILLGAGGLAYYYYSTWRAHAGGERPS